MFSNKWVRSGLAIAVVLIAAAVVYFSFFQPPTLPPVIPITKLGQDVQLGNVKRISVNGATLNVTYRDGVTARSTKVSPEGSFEKTLNNLTVSPDRIAAVEIVYEHPTQFGDILQIGMAFLPLLFIGAILFFFLRRSQGGNNPAMSFSKSGARVFTGDQPTITFADVAGVDEAKLELQEVVEFLKEPDKFTGLGARIPRGVLLVGPPGTGKTLMARAVAGEANVPFFSISGSEFVEMFVGVGASRVRDLFTTAKKQSPCIVFVDEIDAVGRHRGAGVGGSSDEREQTLNQILVEMDGFDTDTNVIIVAATNRPDILDPALLRPGRFDRRVILDRPDMNGRKQILAVHTKGKPLAENTDLGAVAKLTPGFSGADIENLVNESAILAARRNQKTITMLELQQSIEKVIAGPERKSRLISAEEKRIIAYHEAGHALVMQVLPNCDPVYKVSIISRGMALGYTMHLPEDDRYLQRKSKFMDDLAGVLGGRVAEEIVFGDITTGAANDIASVTDLARAMVTRYGMSDALGQRTFGAREELVFLGREISEQRNYGEEVAKQIDAEVKRIISAAHAKANEVLSTYRAQLDAVAQRLMVAESIDRDELARLVARPQFAPIPELVAAPVASAG
ncbi:MAG: ATP-dependent zinc metalloprotease FtsH [Chloroflexi bacterium]|nr:ATP-dependent zinc metalloprotease FtsH [Chloroflexota bacterium]